MGQKVHPIGFRLGIIKTWDSRWFAGKKELPQLIKEDFTLRKYIRNRLRHAAVSKIVIERTPNRATIDIYTARPGVVIGRRGVEVDRLKEELQYLTGKEIVLNVHEIRRPELDALLVAENIARQLEGRVSFRRAMRKAIASAMRAGAQGIKIRCSGRLGGAEIARSHEEKEGRVPLHTLRADIDFARATAYTIYGTIGVKVWIFKGEVLEPQDVGR
ncbi:MAG: 30S ribosomal protein S3 [Candidatus Latescibacterota bacterium]|nr:MAG: 30S ribosomal protein S3 [Candidatus Latescibacterota bacterium]